MRSTLDFAKPPRRPRSLFSRTACRRDLLTRSLSCIFFLCVYLLFFRLIEWSFERAVPPPVITVRWRDVFPELEPVMRELSQCASQIRERFPGVTSSDIYTCDHAAQHGAPPAGPFAPACAAEASGHLRAITEPTDRQMQYYKRRDEEHKARRRAARGCSHTQVSLPSPGRVPSSTFGGGVNFSTTVLDMHPCSSGEDRYLVQLAGPPGGTDDLIGDGIFAQGGGKTARLRLDHLSKSRLPLPKTGVSSTVKRRRRRGKKRFG